jgi:hypothetical protein
VELRAEIDQLTETSKLACERIKKMRILFGTIRMEKVGENTLKKWKRNIKNKNTKMEGVAYIKVVVKSQMINGFTSILHHPENIKIVYKDDNNVFTSNKIQYDETKYHNEESDMVDFITTGDVWKSTGDTVDCVWKCKRCLNSFLIACSCKYETNGFWVTGYNRDAKCKHKELNCEFICNNCRKEGAVK